MRVAWFRAGSSTSVDVADATSAVIGVLARTIAIDIITETRAHGFVVEQAHHPYDLCVFEPRNEPDSDFIWGYLFQYPGVFVLQNRSLHDSRVRGLERHRRHKAYAAEFMFNHGHPSRALGGGFTRGSWPMLRAPLLASRLAVVSDEERRIVLEDAYPGIRFREVPACAAGPLGGIDEPSVVPPGEVLRVATVGRARRAVIERAVQRARDLGANVALTPAGESSAIDGTADVVIALDSLADDATLTPALAAMARQEAVIVFEREATALWPALDPQTWRPRDPFSHQEPVVVSIDPRDEEHSLMLALKGLALDRSRGRALGAAGRTWWLAHGTPERAAAVWRQILDEALTTPSPHLPGDWPAHLKADGAEEARTLAAEIGVDISF